MGVSFLFQASCHNKVIEYEVNYSSGNRRMSDKTSKSAQNCCLQYSLLDIALILKIISLNFYLSERYAYSTLQLNAYFSYHLNLLVLKKLPSNESWSYAFILI